MEIKELFQHVIAIKEYCNDRDTCIGCPLDENVCPSSIDAEVVPGDWILPEEYTEEEK